MVATVDLARDGVLACGTAAVITPVGTVQSAAGSWTVGDGSTGPITARLRKQLLGVQTGQVPDTHGWLCQKNGVTGPTRRALRLAGWSSDDRDDRVHADSD